MNDYERQMLNLNQEEKSTKTDGGSGTSGSSGSSGSSGTTAANTTARQFREFMDEQRKQTKALKSQLACSRFLTFLLVLLVAGLIWGGFFVYPRVSAFAQKMNSAVSDLKSASRQLSEADFGSVADTVKKIDITSLNENINNMNQAIDKLGQALENLDALGNILGN